MKLSTIEKRLVEAEKKFSTYHERAFWASTQKEADRLQKLSDFWYNKYRELLEQLG